MGKVDVLSALLIQDKLIRFNLQMLETLIREIKADFEEVNLLVEACLSEEELKTYKDMLLRVEADLLSKLSEIVDHLYDLYEVFNFEITFLSTLPEELAREIERLNAINSINSKLELIETIFDEILLMGEDSVKLHAILTPFRVYKELMRHGMEFNRKLHELSLQRIG